MIKKISLPSRNMACSLGAGTPGACRSRKIRAWPSATSIPPPNLAMTLSFKATTFLAERLCITSGQDRISSAVGNAGEFSLLKGSSTGVHIAKCDGR